MTIQNFSETEKKRTMSLLLKNESEMSTILNFDLDIPNFCGLDHSNPMLTTILCFLVGEKGVENPKQVIENVQYVCGRFT